MPLAQGAALGQRTLAEPRVPEAAMPSGSLLFVLELPVQL